MWQFNFFDKSQREWIFHRSGGREKSSGTKAVQVIEAA